MGAEIRFAQAQVVHVDRATAEPSEVAALGCVDLVVEPGGFLTISGGKGSGKTTLLDLVSGLVRPSSGAVLVNGDPIDGPGPERSTVFRQFTLLPWRTAAQNVEFALEFAGGWTAAERSALARRALVQVGIEHLADSYPETLTPLDKQRVAIARALSVDPQVLILDEPFADLAPSERIELATDLLRLWRLGRFTVLFATRDVTEAQWLGQRIIELRDGRIRRVYRPVPRAA